MYIYACYLAIKVHFGPPEIIIFIIQIWEVAQQIRTKLTPENRFRVLETPKRSLKATFTVSPRVWGKMFAKEASLQTKVSMFQCCCLIQKLVYKLNQSGFKLFYTRHFSSLVTGKLCLLLEKHFLWSVSTLLCCETFKIR